MSHPFQPNEQYPGSELLAYLENFSCQVVDQTSAIINQRNAAQNEFAEQAMLVGSLNRKCAQVEAELGQKNRELAEVNQQLDAAQHLIETMQKHIDQLTGTNEDVPESLSDHGDDAEEHS